MIDSVQSLGHPADQVIGLACAFKNFCEVLGLDPMEVLRVVSRMEQDCRYRQVNTLNAVRLRGARAETALPVMRDPITDAFIDEALIGFDIDEAFGISADTR